MFFVQCVVDVLDEFGNNLVNLGVFVGGLFRRAGNDQRRTGFVDEDGVHFIDDRELMPALNALRQIILHVVAQIVKTKFVVRAVREIRAIRRLALLIVQIVHDYADGKTEAAIERAHPLGVAPRQVVVHRDGVHAASCQSI